MAVLGTAARGVLVPGRSGEQGSQQLGAEPSVDDGSSTLTRIHPSGEQLVERQRLTG